MFKSKPPEGFWGEASIIIILTLIFLPQLQYLAAAWAVALISIKRYSILLLQTRAIASE